MSDNLANNNKAQKKRRHEESEDPSFNLKEATSKKHTSSSAKQ